MASLLRTRPVIRGPRKTGMSLSWCRENINGWAEFEKHTLRLSQEPTVCYRLTVIRQLFKEWIDNGITEPSFRKMFDVKVMEDFLCNIENDSTITPSTKINKLWALSFVLGWLSRRADVHGDSIIFGESKGNSKYIRNEIRS